MKKFLIRASIVVYIALFIGVILYSILKEKPEEQELAIFGTNVNVQIEQSIFQAYEKLKTYTSPWFPSVEVKKNPAIYIVGDSDSIFKQLLIEGNYGLYIPLSNKLYLSELINENEVYDVFVHEYHHFLFDRYLETHKIDFELYPQWFVEGAAESFTYDVTGHLLIEKGLFDAVPFPDLEIIDEENSTVMYQQGFFALRQLVNEYGPTIVEQLILKTADLESFEDAFEQLTTYELASYHELFQNDSSQFFELYDLAEHDPNQLIETLNTYTDKMGDITPYFTDIFELYSTAYETKEDYITAATYAEKLIEITDEPFDYIRAAKFVKITNPERAKEIMELGKALMLEKDPSSTSSELFDRWIQDIDN